MTGIPGASLALTALEAGALGLLQQLHGKTPRGLQWSVIDPETGLLETNPDGSPITKQLTAQVTIEEDHEDEVFITEHPVEQGATISDHAFKLPARLRLSLGWSNSPSPKNTGLFFIPGNILSGLTATKALFSSSPSSVRSTYEAILALQESRIPITVFTGKRTYDNMLIRRVRTVTKKETENALFVEMDVQQIIIVQTQVVLAPPMEVQKTPQKTAATTNKGTPQPKPVPVQSATQMNSICPATGGDWENANPVPLSSSPQGFGNTIIGGTL